LILEIAGNNPTFFATIGHDWPRLAWIFANSQGFLIKDEL